MHNGEIISDTISRSPDLNMAINMLNAALKKNANLNEFVLHSDQGWHYQHARYLKADALKILRQ